MAEGTYEYECMRAELLGIDKPDYDEFVRKKEEEERVQKEEDIEIENLKGAEADSEQMRHIAGGLDEINSILQVTQRRIHKFKASCGSLTNLLKIKIGHGSSSDSMDVNNGSNSDIAVLDTSSSEGTESESAANGRPSDLARALDGHLDKLDSVLTKAENAQYSMKHQSKEMKKFLN